MKLVAGNKPWSGPRSYCWRSRASRRRAIPRRPSRSIARSGRSCPTIAIPATGPTRPSARPACGSTSSHRPGPIATAAARSSRAIGPPASSTAGSPPRTPTNGCRRRNPARSSHRPRPRRSAVGSPRAQDWQPHWAFLPPQRPPIPRVERMGWVRNPIDAFVLARLEREGLSPSPDAERAILLRRVTLDLTGLPPTLAESKRSNATPHRTPMTGPSIACLSSPRFGERMAVRWLDAARYADTNGYQTDGAANHVAMARLGHRRLQPEPAIRPLHDRATGRRPAPGRDAGSADRDRLQPQPSRQRRGRHHPRGIRRRIRRRPRRHHRDHLAGPDHRLRPMPQPQIRPGHPARVLPALRVLQQRPRERPGGQVRQLAAAHQGPDPRPATGARSPAAPNRRPRARLATPRAGDRVGAIRLGVVDPSTPGDRLVPRGAPDLPDPGFKASAAARHSNRSTPAMSRGSASTTGSRSRPGSSRPARTGGRSSRG